MKLNLLTDKLIAICFPPFAGGKFLMNCLALSKHATFQDNNISLLDLQNIDNNNNVYEFKINQALNRLPNNINQMKKWTTQVEFAVDTFFNWHPYEEIGHCELNEATASESLKILSSRNDINFFIEAHDEILFNKIKNYFPNIKVILIKDFVDFLFIAKKLKSDIIESPKNQKFFEKVHYRYFISSISKYKPDYEISYKNIFDEEKFILEIKNLYEKLGYDDFNSDLITKYYRAYINLHT